MAAIVPAEAAIAVVFENRVRNAGVIFFLQFDDSLVAEDAFALAVGQLATAFALLWLHGGLAGAAGLPGAAVAARDARAVVTALVDELQSVRAFVGRFAGLEERARV